MSFVKGGLKLKGKGDISSAPKKVAGTPSLLDKRPQADLASELEPKLDKKIKPSAAQPPVAQPSVAQPSIFQPLVEKEKPKEETKAEAKVEDKELVEKVEKNFFKTDYEKRIYLQKQQKLKNKIEQKLLTSHREKVEEYNKKLSNIPEHFDVPKVGPG